MWFCCTLPCFIPESGFVTKLLAKSGISHEFVEAMGESSLAQVMSLVLFGDYLSFYLAILNRIDPTLVDSIDFVKGYLAQFSTPSS